MSGIIVGEDIVRFRPNADPGNPPGNDWYLYERSSDNELVVRTSSGAITLLGHVIVPVFDAYQTVSQTLGGSPLLLTFDTIRLNEHAAIFDGSSPPVLRLKQTGTYVISYRFSAESTSILNSLTSRQRLQIDVGGGGTFVDVPGSDTFTFMPALNTGITSASAQTSIAVTTAPTDIRVEVVRELGSVSGETRPAGCALTIAKMA